MHLRRAFAFGLVVASSACGSKASTSTTIDDVSSTTDAGSTNDVTADVGSDTVQEVDSSNSDVPQFNYIPLNDEACVIEQAPDLVIEQAKAVVDGLLSSHVTVFADELDLCSDKASATCPACKLEDNPFLILLRKIDGIYGPLVPTGSFETYFHDALAYRYRFPLISYAKCSSLAPGVCPSQDSTHVVMTQGKLQPCADGTPKDKCNHMSMENQSLDKSCLKFAMSFYGPTTTETDGSTTIDAQLYEAAKKDVSFGFVVPVVKSLPPNPELLSESDLEFWLDYMEANAKRVAVRVWLPEVHVNINKDGSGCGTLKGYVKREVFEQLFASAAGDLGKALADAVNPMIDQYEEKDKDGKVLGIRLIARFTVQPGTFSSGMSCAPNPCTTPPPGQCVGDIFTGKPPVGRCTYPRPAGFKSGQNIDKVCDYASQDDYTVDCGAAGGKCADGKCNVTWRVPKAGELVFSEIITDPPGSDVQEEWIELTNTSKDILDLTGCVITSKGVFAESYQVSNMGGPVVVAPGKQVVLGASKDPALNNGVNVSAQYGPAIVLDEEDDFLTIKCAKEEIDTITWGKSFTDGKGTAFQLSAGKIDAKLNDDAKNWCPATKAFGKAQEGAHGTPGSANDTCP